MKNMAAQLFKAPLWLLSRDPYKRRRVLQEFARMSAAIFGDFQIYDIDRLWREDQEFLHHYRHLVPENPYSQDRKYTLREFVRFTRHVAGDIVECGCFQGASAWFIANEARGVRLHLFDSFEGVSQPGKMDVETGYETPYWTAGDMSATEADVRERLREFDNFAIYRGWIPERFDEVADLKFRLVHVDVDLYQPTLDTLLFFFPRVTKGGVIVMDDYGSTRCPGARRAAEEFATRFEQPIISLPTGQGIIIKS